MSEEMACNLCAVGDFVQNSQSCKEWHVICSSPSLGQPCLSSLSGHWAGLPKTVGTKNIFSPKFGRKIANTGQPTNMDIQARSTPQ